MKFKDSDFSDAMLFCLPDPAEWAAAKWRATVFFYAACPEPDQLPGLGIAFLNFDAGKKIFDGWLKRLGHVDIANELRVSIVEGPVPSDPSGYTVLISTNPLTHDDGRPFDHPANNVTRFIRFSQMNRMNPVPGSPHLHMFKQHFAKAKRFRLFPAHFGQGTIKNIDLSRY